MKKEKTKKPYLQPKLTVHGDLRAITAMKGSTKVEAGSPRTYNQDNN
jgi:hypothetical protein